MNEVAISVQGVSHWFGEGTLRKQILFDVDAVVRAGEIVILTGPSGSGKTTLLTLVGGLRAVQAGSLAVFGHELRGADERTLIEIRKATGYIFQSHNLISALTARQNVEMALQLHHDISQPERQRRAERMLERVGLNKHGYKHPNQLSGGQRQRVAIARALAGSPKILLADEPTGALDKESGREILTIIQRLARTDGVAALVVTHDNRVLDVADRILSMEDGRLSSLMHALTVQTGRMMGSLARDIRQGELTQGVKELDLKGFADTLRSATHETSELLGVMETARSTAFRLVQDQVLEAFAAKVAEFLNAEHAAVFLVDNARKEVWSVERKEGGLEAFSVPLGVGRVGRVAETGRPERGGWGLCIPVAHDGGNTFAVIEATRSAGAESFSSDDEKRLHEFARSLGRTLESWCVMGCACREA